MKQVRPGLLLAALLLAAPAGLSAQELYVDHVQTKPNWNAAFFAVPALLLFLYLMFRYGGPPSGDQGEGTGSLGKSSRPRAGDRGPGTGDRLS